jgi:hypothetical protein
MLHSIELQNAGCVEQIEGKAKQAQTPRSTEMYQRSLFSMLVIGLAFSTAQAAETNRSEFFYQPGAGQSDVSVHVGYRALTTKSKTATADTKMTGWAGRGVGNATTEGMGVGYEYGLNDMLSLGAELAFTSLEVDNGGTVKPKISGLADPMVFVHGTSGMDFGRLRYGANLGLGFQKHKIEANNDTTPATGGFSLTPYVGLDMDAGPGILGARLSYRFNMERTYDANGTEQKVKDGNILGLAAFYEYMLSDMLLGADVNYRMVGEETTTTGAASTTAKSYSPFGLDLYARIPVDESITIIPSLGYDFSASGDDVDKYNDMVIQVAARFGF